MVGKLVRLNEFHNRYNLAVGYERPSDNCLNARGNSHFRWLDNIIESQLDKSASAAAFDGRLRLFGSSVVARQSSIPNGPPVSPLAPVSEIPQTYFSHTRGFTQSGLLSYSDEQPDNVWPDTLHPNERHPDYEEVFISQEALEAFFTSLAYFAADLPGFHSSLPLAGQARLCDVVSFLAFGHPLNAQKMKEHLDPTWKMRLDAFEELAAELQQSTEFDHFPKTLPTDAGDIVGLLFEGVRKPWPVSAEKLYRLAVEQAEKQKIDNLALATASSAIISGIKRGKLLAFGNRRDGKDQVAIPSHGIEQTRNINWLNDSLNPDSPFEGVESWSAVTIDCNSLVGWINEVSRQGAEKKSQNESIQHYRGAVVANRPPTQRRAAVSYLMRDDALPTTEKIEALVSDMKQKTGVSVSPDTMRRALREVNA